MGTIDDIAFEGVDTVVDNNQPENNSQNKSNNDDVTPLNGNNDVTNITNPDDGSNNSNNSDDSTINSSNKDNNTDSDDTNLNVGDSVEFDGKTYTVDSNGNLVDENNNIFKTKDEISDFIKSVDVDDTDNEKENTIDVNAIQDSIGIQVADENGKPIEFTNDIAGITEYINNVIELKQDEVANATINKLYQDAPYVKDLIDYVQLNGTVQGFGQIQDRSVIQIDKDNERQQEAIIRMAAAEFNNSTLSDSYIKYLKDSGSLLPEAEKQLEALIAKDKQVLQERAEAAERSRQEEEENLMAYWDSVKNAVAKRDIAGFKIPETFIVEKNGTKITQTPNDFYRYINTPIKEHGCTAYQYDVKTMSDEERLNEDLLNAWLHFTNKTYKDLAEMLVKESNVKTLKLKAKENNTRKSVRVIKKPSDKVNISDIVF